MIFLVITIADGSASATDRLRLPRRLNALQRVADLVEVDVAVLDDVLGERLDRVALEPVRAYPLGELDQLERRRGDVDADQRRGLGLEQVQRGSEVFGEHGRNRGYVRDPPKSEVKPRC